MRKDIIRSRGYNLDTAGSELSLKIASYPITAKYLATRLVGKGKTVCELCCGVGITLIELSNQFEYVIGVDNDANILHDCKSNLANASVNNYALIHADVTSSHVIKKIKADIVLYDIPYWSSHGGRIDIERENPDLISLIDTIRNNITTNIVIYAPPSLSYEEATAALGTCDFVQVMINDKHDRNFIFLGDLMSQAGKTIVELKI